MSSSLLHVSTNVHSREINNEFMWIWSNEPSFTFLLARSMLYLRRPQIRSLYLFFHIFVYFSPSVLSADIYTRSHLSAILITVSHSLPISLDHRETLQTLRYHQSSTIFNSILHSHLLNSCRICLHKSLV